MNKLSRPLEVLQMPLDVAGALEAFEDQRVLLAADDVLHDLRLPRVGGAATHDAVKDLDQVQNVLVDLGAAGFAQVEEIEQLDVEVDAGAADHNVVVVDVAV